jgi:hypothetical protein
MFTYIKSDGEALTRDEAKQHIRFPQSLTVLCSGNGGRASVENVSGTSLPLHVFDAKNHHAGSTRNLSEALELAEITTLSQG